MREIPVLSRSPDEEVRLRAWPNGTYGFFPDDGVERLISPAIPTEALLAIVADRLKDAESDSDEEAAAYCIGHAVQWLTDPAKRPSFYNVAAEEITQSPSQNNSLAHVPASEEITRSPEAGR